MSALAAQRPPEVTEEVTARAAFERLSAVEEELDLLRYELDGWCVWPLLRKPVADGMTRLSAAIGGKSPPPLARLRRSLGDIASWAALRPASIVAKTYTSGLLERAGDKYKDVWVDDILLAVGSFVKIESVNSPRLEERSRHALVPRSVTTSLLETVAGSVVPRLPASREVERIAAELSRAVRTRLGLAAFDERTVASALSGFRWQSWAYRWLLNRVRPEAVLVTDPSEHALVAAAKTRGVLTAELQHGVTDRYHAGYSWGRYAQRYRPRMPVPNRILVYGEHWRRELAAGGFWGEDVIVVGSPRLDAYRRDGQFARERPDVVLVTTQGIEPERLTEFLAAYLRDSAGASTRLVLKLHPIFDADPLRYITALGGNPRVKVIAGNEDPSTFELLVDAVVHVSVSSATHYDALGFGVPTVVLPLRGHDVVMPLVAAGHARLASEPKELAAVVAAASVSGVPKAVSEYYFAMNSVANIKRALGFDS